MARSSGPTKTVLAQLIMARQSVITQKRRGPAPTGKGTLVGVRLQPDLLAVLDRFIAEEKPAMSRPEALRHAFAEWVARNPRLSSGSTEAAIIASATQARAHAAGAAEDAMSGMDATKQEKAARREALTDEPAIVEKARGKGRQ